MIRPAPERKNEGCPWCDGREHLDKPYASLGPFSAAFVQDSIAQTTLNADTLLLTNGTCNDAAKAQATKALPDWADRLASYDISVEDRVIARFSRVHGNDSDYDDDFRITFTDGESIVRNAIRGFFPAELASDLPLGLNLKLSDESDATVQVDGNMETSVAGIFAVGDANSSALPHSNSISNRAVLADAFFPAGTDRTMSCTQCGARNGRSSTCTVSRPARCLQMCRPRVRRDNNNNNIKKYKKAT